MSVLRCKNQTKHSEINSQCQDSLNRCEEGWNIECIKENLCCYIFISPRIERRFRQKDGMLTANFIASIIILCGDQLEFTTSSLNVPNSSA